MKLSAPKITPFLWFNNNAAEAAAFYTTVFENARIVSTNPMVTVFEIAGQELMALNGGPAHQLSEAFSLVITCNTQEEIDYFWSKLSEGGREDMCGWVKDKFGVSWQVVPALLGQLMGDPERRDRVVQAFLKMKKFNIEALQQA